MKVINVADKTEAKRKRQIQRWFTGNPNRRTIMVKTDKGTFEAERKDYTAEHTR